MKVFILYLLKNIIEPMEFHTINDIVVQDGFVNYFDFSICFSELLEAGQVQEIPGDKPQYIISSQGKIAVESYEDSLYAPVREKALRSALRLLAFNKNGNKVSSEITQTEGGYLLKCSIVDYKKTIFTLEIFSADKPFAEKAAANFEEKAEIIFKGGLALLSGEVDFIFDE